MSSSGPGRDRGLQPGVGRTPKPATTAEIADPGAWVDRVLSWFVGSVLLFIDSVGPSRLSWPIVRLIVPSSLLVREGRTRWPSQQRPRPPTVASAPWWSTISPVGFSARGHSGRGHVSVLRPGPRRCPGRRCARISSGARGCCPYGAVRGDRQSGGRPRRRRGSTGAHPRRSSRDGVAGPGARLGNPLVGRDAERGAGTAGRCSTSARSSRRRWPNVTWGPGQTPTTQTHDFCVPGCKTRPARARGTAGSGCDAGAGPHRRTRPR